MFSYILPLVAVAFCISSHPDTLSTPADPVVEAAVVLSGAGSAEELDEAELERFRTLASHPLPINQASRGKLLSSGILTAYQVASFEAYKAANGDVMSFAELVSINGFNRECVALLRHFVTLDSSSPPGSRRSGRVYHEIISRANWKMAERESVAAGGTVRYHLECNDVWELSIGLRESSVFRASGKRENSLCEGFSIAYVSPWSGRRLRVSKAVVGDYSLRFGQGLAMWNGLSFSGVSSVSSFSRNPTGAVPYRSYSASSIDFGKSPSYSQSSTVLRGAATEVSAGRFSTTAALAYCGGRDILSVLNAAFYGRIHQESVTAYVRTGADGSVSDAKLSADGRVNVRGTDLFAELAFDARARSAAFLAGTSFKATQMLSLSAMARFYPSNYSAGYSGAVRSSGKCSDEHGASVAAQLKAGDYVGYQPSHLLDVSIDGAWHPSKRHSQLKILSTYTWTRDDHWQLCLRFQQRLRNYDIRSRTELRSDLRWGSGVWGANCRAHAVYGTAFAVLGYAEAVFRPSRTNLYARVGAFHTKGWEDRIYVYERDAPGGFSAPAMYGDGAWTSAYMTFDPIPRMRMYARFSLVYAHERPLHAEAAFQIRILL